MVNACNKHFLCLRCFHVMVSIEGGDEHISCDSPMQRWDESADWTYNTYTEGSVVWARVVGYPWWPAIVEVDPDMEAFVFCYEYRRYTPVSVKCAV
ncbi:ZCWPW1 [Bugula neritina]|uniref:ZCWPW1 n=1 Tax=Bugula neritina TaxID=10212 RepID=A0A7J7KS51_BUGNE|nr:ZCWPW1 [Bugula neritina]